MLYEKTLSRKLVGETVTPTAAHPGEADLDNNVDEADGLLSQRKARIKSMWHPVTQFADSLGKSIRRRFSREKAEQPASIGKIYNLMRYEEQHH